MPGNVFLKFIKSRIEKLETALFYNYSNAVVRFPTTIIRLQKVDANGTIWFKTRRPYNDISGLDRTFPGELHFYRKSYRYYIIVRGEATVIPSDALIRDGNESLMGCRRDELMLSFKISAAEYFPVRENMQYQSVHLISNFVKSLFGDDSNFHLAFSN